MIPLLQTAINNILLAAALAVFALIVTRIWRNQHVAHLLWVIVLAKLVSPPLWNAPIAVSDFPASTLVVGIGDNVVGAGSQAEVVEVNATETFNPLNDEAAANSGRVASVAKPADRSALARNHWHTILTLVAQLWIGSSGLCALVVLVRVARFHRLVRRGRTPDDWIVERAERVGARLGLRSLPDVRLLDAGVSPMIWPLSRRRMLLLPQRIVDELAPEQLDTVIAHELAHVVRRDEWVRLLETVVTCLFWWNPMVWFARSQLREAEENCCDGLVVCSLPGSRWQYGQALLRTAEMITFGRPLPALASAFGQQRILRRRIEWILNRPYRRSASWRAKLLLGVLSAAVLPLASDAKSREEQLADPLLQAEARAVAKAEATDEVVVVLPGDPFATVTTERTEKGHLRFTINRGLKKRSDKAIRGQLVISNAAGILAEFAVEAEANGDDVEYGFVLAERCLSHSKFLLREDATPTESGEIPTGGVTVYEIRLADHFGNATASRQRVL